MQTKFAKFIKDEWIICKHAKGTGAAPNREFHDYHEILFFINGKTKFLSEEKHIELSPLQIVMIPKKTYHQFVNEIDEEYHRCVFSFYDIPELKDLIGKCMPRIRVIEANEKQKMLFYKIMQTVEKTSPKNEKQLVMHAVLTLILSEIAHENTFVGGGSNLSDVTSECIEWISANLTKKITIPTLAKKLNVSVSTLTQTFKKDMNISVYRYILRKKLILAQEKMKDGMPAATAAQQCGFHDYSGFYKQYKKMFGITPSEKATGFDV